MGINFPSSPTVGQKHPTTPVAGIPTYTWDGEKWTTMADAIAGDVYVKKVGDTMSGPLVMPSSGTAAATSLNFGSANAGVFGSTSSVSVSTAGVTRLGVSTTSVTSALPVVLPADPVNPLEATTKQYVDSVAISRTVVPLVGGKSFDVAVPANKNFARLSGIICPTSATSLVLILQVSLQAGVFLTSTADYSTNGFHHFVSTTPTAVSAIAGVAQVGMQITTGNASGQYPVLFDGMMVLKRADTTNSRFNGDFRSFAVHTSGGMTHSFIHTHVTTSAGTFGSILAIRLMSPASDNWGAGSYLYVDWM